MFWETTGSGAIGVGAGRGAGLLVLAMGGTTAALARLEELPGIGSRDTRLFAGGL